MQLRKCCNHPYLFPAGRSLARKLLTPRSSSSSASGGGNDDDNDDDEYDIMQINSMSSKEREERLLRVVHSSGKMVLLNALLDRLVIRTTHYLTPLTHSLITHY